jgi:exopolysaccharide production protein ExoQ
MTEFFTFVVLPLSVFLLTLILVSVLVLAAGAANRWKNNAFSILMLLLAIASVGSIVFSFRHLVLGDQGLSIAGDGDAGSGMIAKLLLMSSIGCAVALCLAWFLDFNGRLKTYCRYRERGFQVPTDITVSFMVFYVCFSIFPIFGGHRFYFHISLIYPFFVYLALFLWMRISKNDPVIVLKQCLGLFVFGSLFYAAVAPQSAFQPGYVGLIPGFSLRLWGVTAHANSLGSVACAMFILEIAENSKKRWLSVCILLASAAAMLMSQSKTSILTALLGLLIIKATQFWREMKTDSIANRNGNLISISLIIIFCLSIFIYGIWMMFFDTNLLGSIERHLNPSAVGDLSSGTGRAWIWQAAVNAGLDSPIFGQGADFWNLENRMRLGLSGAVHAHNLYLQVFSRSGFVGLISLLVFLYLLLQYAGRAANRTGGASIALISVFLVRAMTEVPLSPNAILGAEFFATMAYIFYVIDRGARPLVAQRVPISDFKFSEKLSRIN